MREGGREKERRGGRGGKWRAEKKEDGDEKYNQSKE